MLVREITSELLGIDGREIVAVGTAEDALREFRSREIDVVITDVSLPAMSGLELARQLLAIEPELPVIIASGYSLDLTLQRWGPSVRSIIKPFEAVDIGALIDELSSYVRLRRESSSIAAASTK